MRQRVYTEQISLNTSPGSYPNLNQVLTLRRETKRIKISLTLFS